MQPPLSAGLMIICGFFFKSLIARLSPLLRLLYLQGRVECLYICNLVDLQYVSKAGNLSGCGSKVLGFRNLW